MRNASTLFARVLADLFRGTPANQASPDKAAAAPPAGPATVNDDPLYAVGQGAPNETLMTIGDTPHLFVDEGDHIVQFTPAFDDHTEETEFGMKIMPDLVPHWSKVKVHCCELKAAIVAAIRDGYSPVVAPDASDGATAKSGQAPANSGDEPAGLREATPSRSRSSNTVDLSAVTGRIASWGGEKFPDRKRPGRFYESFAIHIETDAGERTLQGEGLKEAIAESRCVVGDVVSVRRLRKIKVPAIRADGTPKVVDGKQVMWDKWLWSISK